MTAFRHGVTGVEGGGRHGPPRGGMPAVCDGGRLLVDITRKTPAAGGTAVLRVGTGLAAGRVEPLPETDPPGLRPFSANPAHKPCDRPAGEAHTAGTVLRIVRRV